VIQSDQYNPKKRTTADVKGSHGFPLFVRRVATPSAQVAMESRAKSGAKNASTPNRSGIACLIRVEPCPCGVSLAFKMVGDAGLEPATYWV
jgi:hypothetical protein